MCPTLGISHSRLRVDYGDLFDERIFAGVPTSITASSWSWREPDSVGVDSVAVNPFDPGFGDVPVDGAQMNRTAAFLGVGIGMQFNRR